MSSTPHSCGGRHVVWQPNQVERHVISHRLEYTVVTESDKWMGACKHQYLHWLRCQLPRGRHSLADLKLGYPGVIPIRDRMAAPLRLASWVRFETVMDRREWSTAIAMLVPAIHLPDTVEAARSVCAGARYHIHGRGTGSPVTQLSSRRCSAKRLCRAAHCTSPIPFREVFVILALFLPQLPFAEGAGVGQLWLSPVPTRGNRSSSHSGGQRI